MKIRISETKPTTKPIREYETRFIYIGFKYRYDTQSKLLSSIERQSDGSIAYVETPAVSEVFSRGYSSEHTRVAVYSDSPRIWSEENVVFTELTDKVLR